MPRYAFALDGPRIPGDVEQFPTDSAAKRHACVVADEINRNATSKRRVLVFDDDGELLAVVAPVEE